MMEEATTTATPETAPDVSATSPFSSIVPRAETKVWTPACTVDIDRKKDRSETRLVVRGLEAGPDADSVYRAGGGAPLSRVTAKGSDDERDRHGTIFMPLGCQLGPYRDNPIVKYQHGGGQLLDVALGASTAVEAREDGVFFQIRLANTVEGLQGEIRDLVYSLSAMYEEGIMRAFSIGAEALQYVFPDGKEEARVRGSRHPYLDPGTLVRQWELWELSAVDIGSNVNALTIAERSALRSLADHYAPRIERERGTDAPLADRLREIASGTDPKPETEMTAPEGAFHCFRAGDVASRGDETARAAGFHHYFEEK